MDRWLLVELEDEYSPRALSLKGREGGRDGGREGGKVTGVYVLWDFD